MRVTDLRVWAYLIDQNEYLPGLAKDRFFSWGKDFHAFEAKIENSCYLSVHRGQDLAAFVPLLSQLSLNSKRKLSDGNFVLFKFHEPADFAIFYRFL